ncbi:hypothetical protein GC174_17255 [bacterium]|nr:hypothetical protein [bacterium]
MSALSSFIQMVDQSYAASMHSIEKTDIEHPYWQIMSRLELLDTSTTNEALKQSLLQLALDMSINPEDKLILEGLLRIPAISLPLVKSKMAAALRERYAYSPLSPAMLDTICNAGPIIEVGSGNGYNAWLLRQKLCAVEAYDISPVDRGGNWFYLNGFGLPASNRESWTEVKQGDCTVAGSYPDHTLLLCWPARNSMAIDAVNYYLGSRVIFIGDKKNCASPAFFEEMEEYWDLEHESVRSVWQISKAEHFLIYSR